MVLGCELPVVEVMSVAAPSASVPRRLERDAVVRGSGVRRVPLSTLRLPSSMALISASLRLMLFVLAVFLRSAPVVAVSGGLGGALVGAAGELCFRPSGLPFASLPPSISVASGVRGFFLFSGSSRE